MFNTINRGSTVGSNQSAANLLASLFDKKFMNTGDSTMSWKLAANEDSSYANNNIKGTYNKVVKPHATSNAAQTHHQTKRTIQANLSANNKQAKSANATPVKHDPEPTPAPTTVTKRTTQQELDAKRDTLCQLLNLKSSDGLRNLETWHDEDGENVDERCFGELVDPSNPNGWSADDMFEYNEKRHKITSSYTERTLADNYTTPLPKQKSKSTVRMATQLAKEIEANQDGRVTPESSDDDELFEQERINRVLFKKHKQLEHSKNPQQHGSNHQQRNRNHQNTPASVAQATDPVKTNEYRINVSQLFDSVMNCNQAARSCAKTTSSSQYSNKSTETPATASLSSSPTLNDSNNIIKPVASSSRNILRACLT